MPANVITSSVLSSHLQYRLISDVSMYICKVCPLSSTVITTKVLLSSLFFLLVSTLKYCLLLFYCPVTFLLLSHPSI